MKNYTKIYLTAINELTDDNNVFINCECCNGRASEIHHILNKNRLTENRNKIENIMAVCRKCHNDYGEINYLIPSLFKIHSKVLELKGIKFNKNWIKNKIKFYENKY